MTEIFAWMAARPLLMTGLGSLSLVIFLVGLACVPRLVSLIPEDYFVPKSRPTSGFREKHPTLRLLLLVLKNLLGLTLLVAGFMMLFLPGPGVLTLLVGLLTVDYPGKFRLERKLVSYPPILHALNRQRHRAGKPPLITE